MRRAMDSVFRGLFLVVLGVVFFLNNYGLLPWGFWVNIVDLWPLLLIVAGIALFFSRRLPFSAVMLVFLLALVGYSFMRGVPQFGDRLERAPLQQGAGTTMDLSVPLENGVVKSELNLNLGGAHVNVYGVKAELNHPSLLTGTYQSTNRFNFGSEPKFSNERSGDTARIKFNAEKRPSSGNSNLDLKLSDQVEYRVDVNAGAVSGILDFSQLRVKELDMSTGASDIELRFGDTGAHTKADLSTGASKLTLVVPENVGLKIHLSGIASDTNFTGDGLFLSDKNWVSTNYDSAKTRIEMDISMGAGKVDLQRSGTTKTTY
jgi:hypothetical protein